MSPTEDPRPEGRPEGRPDVHADIHEDVHTVSGRRLGVSDPQQDGPVDLRLVPPALSTWAAAALAVGAPGRWTAVGTVVCLVAGLALLVVSRTAARGTSARPAGEGDTRDGGRSAVRRRRLHATAAAAALLCAAAGATAAGLHSAYLRQQPVHGLAQRFAKVEAEVTVTSDARQTRTQVRGDHSTPVALLLDAEITRLTAPGGAATRLRVPVLVIVSPDRSAERWQRLLPSTRLRLTGHLSPPLHSGERNAAVLRPDGNGPPRVIGPPTLLQRAAGGLRAGLRTATDGLEPDARALLPGLVVGDTSRVTPNCTMCSRRRISPT